MSDKMAYSLEHHFRPQPVEAPSQDPPEVPMGWNIRIRPMGSSQHYIYGPNTLKDFSLTQLQNMVFMVVGLGWSSEMVASTFGTSNYEVNCILLTSAGSDLARKLRQEGNGWAPPWSGKVEKY